MAPYSVVVVRSWGSRLGEEMSRGFQDALGCGVISLTVSGDKDGFRDVVVSF